MEVRYQRELNENYLILEDENAGDEYSVRMLEENEIPGFLRMKRAQMDQKWSFRYEISGYQSLQKILERRPISAEELYRLFVKIEASLETMEKYLLPLDGVRLEPEFIYLKPDFSALLLCYHPGNEDGFFAGVKRLTQYLLNKIDHTDSESVEIVYEMFRISGEDDFGFRDLMQVFRQEEEDAEFGSEFGEEYNPEEKNGEKAGEKTREKTGEKAGKKTGTAGKDKNTGVPGKEERNPAVRDIKTEESPADTENFLTPESDLLPEYLQEKRRPVFFILIPAAGMIGLAVLYFMGFLDGFTMGIRLGILLGGLLLLSLAGYLLYRQEYHPDPVWEAVRGEAFASGGPRTECLSEETQKAPRDLCLVSQNLLHHENLKITEFPWILGKVPGECTCLLESTVISRLHARMEYREGDLILYDLGSTNGTFVNQRRLKAGEACVLQSGDQISFADFAYLLQI